MSVVGLTSRGRGRGDRYKAVLGATCYSGRYGLVKVERWPNLRLLSVGANPALSSNVPSRNRQALASGVHALPTFQLNPSSDTSQTLTSNHKVLSSISCSFIRGLILHFCLAAQTA